ncbi:unnamed protein product, partial [Iphiclides podalirius]
MRNVTAPVWACTPDGFGTRVRARMRHPPSEEARRETATSSRSRPVLFAFATVTRSALSQSQGSAGRRTRVRRRHRRRRRRGPTPSHTAGGPVRAMAAQPTRPPPDNLLFRGPPPTLPRVLLVPNDHPSAATKGCTVLSAADDADALREINNVGVPTYGEPYDTAQRQNDAFENDPKAEQQPAFGSLLRRSHSFDISYIYSSKCDDELVAIAYRQRRSEPDLSKYGLFVEADVAMQCEPMAPASLVLNNPFYDGSFALDPALLDRSIVALPDNYLAFEDSFVPTWDYKPEFLNNTDLNPELYYETLPIVPSNDPWSVYEHNNSNFGYYAPQLEVPTEDGIQYMRLSELEFALPQYMSLPTVLTIDPLNNQTKEHNDLQAEKETNNNVVSDNVSVKQEVASSANKKEPLSPSTAGITPTNEQNSNEVPTNRDSSRSAESLNADVSNDVTSSLAFIPSSKSSQILSARDDTSDDTSPCSTDYQEASALDLTQSLGELSSCVDSTEFSQSRDDVSPAPAEATTKFASSEIKKKDDECNGPLVPSSEIAVAKMPLRQLPSIPHRDDQPTKLPPVPENPPSTDSVVDKPKTALAHNQPVDAKTVVNIADKAPPKPGCNQSVAICSSKVKGANVRRNLPTPPSVPPAWLSNAPTGDRADNVQKNVPQICIQRAEGQTRGADKSPKATQQAPAKGCAPGAAATEPQPSCSFAPPPQPPHNSQLKPDKQPKEVEVSQHFSILRPHSH